jgi:hypothetical protein
MRSMESPIGVPRDQISVPKSMKLLQSILSCRSMWSLLRVLSELRATVAAIGIPNPGRQPLVVGSLAKLESRLEQSHANARSDGCLDPIPTRPYGELPCWHKGLAGSSLSSMSWTMIGRSTLSAREAERLLAADQGNRRIVQRALPFSDRCGRSFRWHPAHSDGHEGRPHRHGRAP